MACITKLKHTDLLPTRLITLYVHMHTCKAPLKPKQPTHKLNFFNISTAYIVNYTNINEFIYKCRLADHARVDKMHGWLDRALE